tara:strand:+ start:489 stop:659 length:171 start_codon:yes stop_codon:yes gene_type:complete
MQSDEEPGQSQNTDYWRTIAAGATVFIITGIFITGIVIMAQNNQNHDHHHNDDHSH